MKSLPRTLVFIVFAIATLQIQPLAAAAIQDASAATEKIDHDGRFRKLHESFLARGKQKPIGLLFLGDSITAGWVKAPEVWNKYFSQYQPANFGIGGDRTQHVIWRIENGELDGIAPQVVVLLLGTNNTASNTAEEIAAADKKIVRLIQDKIPAAKILVLGIFPRGVHNLKQEAAKDDSVSRMQVIHEANRQLATLDDGKKIRFLDIGTKFLAADGTIPESIMPDQLHPSAAGYAIWAAAMQPTLNEMMK